MRTRPQRRARAAPPPRRAGCRRTRCRARCGRPDSHSGPPARFAAVNRRGPGTGGCPRSRAARPRRRPAAAGSTTRWRRASPRPRPTRNRPPPDRRGYGGYARRTRSARPGLLCRVEIGPQRASLAEVHVPGAVILGCVVVDEHADHARKRARDRDLASAQERHPVQPEPTGGQRRVAVKMQLTIASGSSPLRSISSRKSSLVAPRIASAVLDSTLVAPRRAKSRIGG